MMAAKPQVLIFDEPTSNLDPTATAEVFEVIDHIRAKAGITVIVIEHKMDYLLPFEPRLVAMEEGAVVYDGPAAAWSGPLRRSAAATGRPRGANRTPQGLEGRQGRHEPRPLVEVDNLQAGHNGVPTLKQVNARFGPGDFISVMGDNGSGKTTFLISLLGLLKPSSGYVRLLDMDTRQVPVSQLARQVGLVFQNPDHQLFTDSVWHEAAFAVENFGLMDSKTHTQIASLLARSGIDGHRDDHPYRLSYGQKRRLNLVSVLSHNPKLILLDEILIGQDAANAAFVMDLLSERVDKGSTVVMVNHAPAITRRYASRVLFFQEGEIVVDGPTEAAFDQLAAMGRKAYAA
jgi:energy-coupling factor transport system ATP-binding protein